MLQQESWQKESRFLLYWLPVKSKHVCVCVFSVIFTKYVVPWQMCMLHMCTEAVYHYRYTSVVLILIGRNRLTVWPSIIFVWLYTTFECLKYKLWPMTHVWPRMTTYDHVASSRPCHWSIHAEVGLELVPAVIGQAAGCTLSITRFHKYNFNACNNSAQTLMRCLTWLLFTESLCCYGVDQSFTSDSSVVQ